MRSEDHDRVVRALTRDWTGFHHVRVSNEVAHWAGDLAERLALRGFDAIHLASALRAQAHFTEEVRFLTFDERLVAAARRMIPVYETR